jgi:hypothetical protein
MTALALFITATALMTLDSRAEPVAFEFRGHLDEVVVTEGVFDAHSPGDQFVVRLSYEAARMTPGPGVSGTSYDGFDPATGLWSLIGYEFRVGGAGTQTYTHESVFVSTVTVWKAPHGDEFSFHGESDGAPFVLRLNLFDAAGGALPDESLPAALRIEDWTEAFIYVIDGPGDYIRGNIHGIQQIPEPGVGALAASGILLIHAIQRSRKRKAACS